MKALSEEPPGSNRWQAFVDRPVSENYEASTTCSSTATSLLQPRPLPPAGHPARGSLPLGGACAGRSTGTALEAEITALQQRGYLRLPARRRPKPGAVTALLDEALGPGQPLAGGDRVWRLDLTPTSGTGWVPGQVVKYTSKSPTGSTPRWWGRWCTAQPRWTRTAGP